MDQKQNQLLQMVYRMLLDKLKKILMNTLKGTVGFLPILIVVGAMMAIGFLFSLKGPTAQNPDDTMLKGLFNKQDLETLQAASESSVDSGKPEQQAFKLTPQVLVALRTLALNVKAGEFDLERAGNMLKPQFSYSKYPVTTTKRWENCDDVMDPATLQFVQSCTTHVDKTKGEVRMLTKAVAWDGITSFTYKEESRTRDEGSTSITETYWALDKQLKAPDDAMLRGTVVALKLAPPGNSEAIRFAVATLRNVASATRDPLQAGSAGWVAVGGSGSSGGVAPPSDVYKGKLPPIDGGWMFPIANCNIITSSFGMRQSPIDGVWRMHAGFDVGGAAGADILAVASGVVTYAGYDDVFGNRVVITHPNGMRTTYNHMTETILSQGQPIQQGQKVGKEGTTGWSTAAHLHFEVYMGSGAVDPMTIYPNLNLSVWE